MIDKSLPQQPVRWDRDIAMRNRGTVLNNCELVFWVLCLFLYWSVDPFTVHFQIMKVNYYTSVALKKAFSAKYIFFTSQN